MNGFLANCIVKLSIAYGGYTHFLVDLGRYLYLVDLGLYFVTGDG